MGISLFNLREYCLKVIQNKKLFIYFFVLLTYSAFPAFPIALQSISFALTLIITLSILLIDFKSINKREIRNHIAITACYWICGFSVLWTENIQQYLNDAKYMFLLFLIPIMLLIKVRLSQKYISILKYVFIISSFILSIKILVYCSYGYTMLQHYHGNLELYNMNLLNRLIATIPLGYEEIFNAAQYTYPNKNGLLHRNYSTAVYLVSVLFIFDLLGNVKRVFTKLVLALFVVYFIINIFYYRSLINSFLVLIIPIIIAMYNLKFNYRRLLFLTLSISFLVGILLNVHFIWDTLRKHDIERYILYNSSLYLIKENFILGIGLGDVYNELNSHNFNLRNAHNIKELNCHSQFLFMFLSAGVIAFASFIGSFGILLYRSCLCLLNFLLLVVIIANCMFENFLSRMGGIELFMLILIFLNLNTESSDKYDILDKIKVK